jgi:hypothetical protein
MIRFFKIAQMILYCVGSFEGYFEVNSFKYFSYVSSLFTYVCKGGPFLNVVLVVVLEVIVLFF